MKKSILLILSIMMGLFFMLSNSSAKNIQEYNTNKAQCEKFIELSRKALEDDNLPLALAYAKKAVQSDTWNKFAWANYNDIVQQMADNGDIEEYGTFVEESKANDAPSADEGPVQLEGC